MTLPAILVFIVLPILVLIFLMWVGGVFLR